MAVFYTADLHMGHTNIIKYCDRPFGDATEMNEALIDNWNSVVGHHDMVWILGDFVLGDLETNLAAANRLHGHKVLVVGNHDRMFRANPSRKDRMERLYIERAGLTGVIYRNTPTKICGIPVLLSHFPYDDRGDARFAAQRPHDDGSTWLIHGHVHNRWKVDTHGRMVNVGVDVWDFTPVHEDDLGCIVGGWVKLE